MAVRQAVLSDITKSVRDAVKIVTTAIPANSSASVEMRNIALPIVLTEILARDYQDDLK